MHPLCRVNSCTGLVNYNIKQLKQNNMKKNMGSADRIIRLLVAAALAALFFTNTITGTWGIGALVVAGVFAVTSLVSFCPIYALLGLNTCPAAK
jgi:fatty acid desaturase